MSKKKKAKKFRKPKTEAAEPKQAGTDEPERPVVVEPEPEGIKCRKCGYPETAPFGVIRDGKQQRVCRKCQLTFWADYRKTWHYPAKSCCPECGSDKTERYSTKPGQQYRGCKACGHKYSEQGVYE